ncbi:MAG: methyltransferase family protein [Candidatus Thorarchaeota archaeon]
MENSSSPSSPTLAQKLREKVLDVGGYLIPLFQSVPFSYAGLMSAPFIFYLVGLIATAPVALPVFVFALVLGGFPLELATSAIGFLLLVYSVLYLRMNKMRGLVTDGPYKFIRHPQYLGVLLLTLSLTTRSVWIITHTFEISYYTGQMAIIIWYTTLVAYVLLALAEEQYLISNYSEEYTDYLQTSGFFIPYLITKRRLLDIILSIILLFLLMHGTLLLYENVWDRPFGSFS